MSGEAPFISLEGMDGAGKTSVMQTIQRWITQQGHACNLTREPGGTPLAEALRQLLLTPRDEKIHPDTELLLMLSARTQHVKTHIQPLITQGTWVVSDRFFDASYAYQGGGRGMDMARIASLHDWALGDFKPSLTLLLDLPVAVGKARVANRGEEQTRFEEEQLAFFEAVRTAYLARARAEPERIVVIDASQSQIAVQTAVIACLEQRFGSQAVEAS
jgi:dTMP kinase